MSRKLSALVAALVAISSVADAQTTVPISQLPSAATPLGGTEMIPCVQGGVTKNCLEKSLGQNLDSLSVTGSGSINGALNLGGLFTPTSTIGVKGTTAGDNVQAGSVGELATSSFTAVTIAASATPQNCATLSLAAGDWDVQGNATFGGLSGGAINVVAGVNTTSATFPTNGMYGIVGGATLSSTSVATPIARVNVSTPTTAYLVCQATYSNGQTVTVAGFIRARRVR